MALTDGTLAQRDHQIIDGLCKTYIGTNQAANTEFTETVPAGKLWNILGVSVALVQGITQTPWPSLVIDDGTRIVFQSFAGTAAVSASISPQITWAAQVAQTGAAASLANTGTLPQPCWAGPGFKVRSVTSGIGANTDYGAPTFYVVEYEIT